MYRIEYMMWTRRYNTSCVQDELCRVRHAAYPKQWVIYVWATTSWLVAGYSYRRGGRCVVYTNPYAV